MAFGALEKHGRDQDIKLVPCGINYTAADEFRSEVIIACGDPISIQDYLAMYDENSNKAVRTLTNKLEEEMKKLIIHVEDEQADTSYQPVIVIFAVAGLMALGLSWYSFENIFTLRGFEWFISISMCFLAVQKLQDIESFSTMFLNYDLLAQRWVPYGKVYPFGEALAGIAMTAGALLWLVAPVAIVIGGIGAVSVIKAVYIDKRELKCACVGGSSNVPLGFISLTENLMMLGMGGWMLARMF